MEAVEAPPHNDPPSGDVEVFVWNGLLAYGWYLTKDLEGTSRPEFAEPGTGDAKAALTPGRR
jgi:hypothetical protein